VINVKVMIGIPAYEEANNIGKLLDFLCNDWSQEIDDIYVVSSGSKDGTDKITLSYSEKDPRVHLIVEGERRGKASALNILLKESEKYDFLIYMGADNLPEKGAISALISKLKEEDLVAVGARPVPLNSKETLTGFFVHVLWNLHHLFSLKSPKLSGELMAFKTGLVHTLPPAIINDDMYMQSFFEQRGLKLGYCHEAKVYLMGPSTLMDFIKQRRRVFVGHKQVESLTRKKVPTMRWPELGQILKACPFSGVKGGAYALLFVAFQTLALLISRWDLYRNNLPYKWDIAKTTKTLRT